MRVVALLMVVVLAGCFQPPDETIPLEDAEEEGIPMTEDGVVDLSYFGVSDDPFWGNASAPVQVVAYDAPGCPNCARYHATHQKGILADFAETGRIGYYALQWAVGYGYDGRGNIAAECAFREGGTPAFALAMDRIFEEQRDTGALPGILDEVAASFDLNPAVLQSCFENDETQAAVDEDLAGGRDSRAGSNPGFAVIGPDGIELIRGASGPRAAIERALGDA